MSKNGGYMTGFAPPPKRDDGGNVDSARGDRGGGRGRGCGGRGGGRAKLDLSHGFVRSIVRNQNDRAAYESAWQ